MYLGTIDWESIRFTAKASFLARKASSAKFTLREDGFTLEQGIFNAGSLARGCSGGDARLRATEMEFSVPRMGQSAGYSREPSLAGNSDASRTFMAKRSWPMGQFRGTGSYSGHEITLTYPIFHVSDYLAEQLSYRQQWPGRAGFPCVGILAER